MLLYYLRRRRSQTLTVVFEGDGALDRHMDEVQRPMLDQGTHAETFPETITPLMKPYVCVSVPPIAFE